MTNIPNIPDSILDVDMSLAKFCQLMFNEKSLSFWQPQVDIVEAVIKGVPVRMEWPAARRAAAVDLTWIVEALGIPYVTTAPPSSAVTRSFSAQAGLSNPHLGRVRLTVDEADEFFSHG